MPPLSVPQFHRSNRRWLCSIPIVELPLSALERERERENKSISEREREGERERARHDNAIESGGAVEGVPDSIQARLGLRLLLLLHR